MHLVSLQKFSVHNGGCKFAQIAAYSNSGAAFALVGPDTHADSNAQSTQQKINTSIAQHVVINIYIMEAMITEE